MGSHKNLKDSKDKKNKPDLRGHIQIARPDHWFKNVFVLPGFILAIGLEKEIGSPYLLINLVIGLISVCVIASSNYTINELIDAQFDRHHPTKYMRPVPMGSVNIPIAYIQWIILMFMGVGIGLLVSASFAMIMACFWLMGCVYNIPPLRTKDLPYLDVLSEAVNNPIRLLAGWFIVDPPHKFLPLSLILSYWMIGCYFMAAKRFAEYRVFKDKVTSTAYRKSFSYYDEPRLLGTMMFYSSTSMLFFGAFIMRYRLELILSFPLIALIITDYLLITFRENSPVQTPEKIYKESILMISLIFCAILIIILLLVDIPALHTIFAPTA